MSFVHSPKIVTDQLALYLDASNINSYSLASSGTWKDLTTYNNSTMYGSVPYQNDGRSYFDFSSATGTVTGANGMFRAYSATLGFTFSNNMVARTGNFTLSCWIKDAPSHDQLGMFSNAGGPEGYRFGPSQTNVYYLIGGSGGAGYTEGAINYGSPSALSSGVWYNICTVYNRTNNFVSCYLNGSYKGSGSIPTGYANSPFANTAPGLIRSSCCTVWSGKLATFSVHNKDLSQAEITQNFNALRGRFGV